MPLLLHVGYSTKNNFTWLLLTLKLFELNAFTRMSCAPARSMHPVIPTMVARDSVLLVVALAAMVATAATAATGAKSVGTAEVTA
eukprot:5045116-Pleurochrysis_carterae.AAC.3